MLGKMNITEINSGFNSNSKGAVSKNALHKDGNKFAQVNFHLSIILVSKLGYTLPPI
jgi:hypothetical protein